jgi:hypothetical protein
VFIYYQERPDAPWSYVLESVEALKDLADRKVGLQSVISIKEPLDSEDDKYDSSYKGPFYVDIDLDGEPQLAMDSARKFSDKLQDLGVNTYAIYLSGKKGFHFIIPMTTFAKDRPVKSLPLIYKEMALELYVNGVDMAVYNQGKPRLLRTANVKRKDNGKYKVPISLKELDELTVEKYAQLTEAPRPELQAIQPVTSTRFQTLYETAKIKMQKKQKALSALVFVPDDELTKTVTADGKLPQCINLLIENGDTKSGANFNQASIQFAAYMVRAGVKNWVKHAQDMAKNVKSSSYKSEFSRFAELKKMVNYVASSKQYGFSKAMLFSVIEPCRDCVICNGTVEDGEVIPENFEEISDITDTPQGYFIGEGKYRRRLTTFTLEVVSKFSETSDEGVETRIGAHAIVKVNGHKRGKITLLEDSWDSTRAFKQSIRGKSNYAFYGSDPDLQKLQNKLFADESAMTDLTHVKTVGIHHYKVANSTIFVYAEPGFSMASNKELNTHEIWGDIPAPPDIKSAAYPEAGEELMELIDKLILSNDPLVTSTLIGWLSVCHIKVQLTMRDNQFPLLNLWGNAECGKSSISTLFAYLHGIDYMLEQSPMSLQGTTPWAASQYCSTSTSTVRLIEEFNQSEIPESKFNQFVGIFKAAWNKQAFAKGGIASGSVGGVQMTGARVMENVISAPLCIMSEQSPDRPALRQRMVQVNVKKSGREREGATDNYHHVIDNKHLLSQLARALVFSSLGTHPEWVSDTMASFKDVVPKEIGPRPQFSYQAVLTGIMFFGKTLKTIGLDQDYIDEKTNFMCKTVIDNLQQTLETVRVEKSRTEMVIVLAEMALMADAYDRDVQFSLEPGRDYLLTKGILYLDMGVCHRQYTRWARSAGETVYIKSMVQFKVLAEQEEFFSEICTHVDLGDGARKLVAFDVEGMKKRGIETNMFLEAL